MGMRPKGWTTLAIRRATKDKLREIKELIWEETGLDLTLEATIAFLANYYLDSKKESNPLTAATARG
ncbi:MAG: hypothetical protein QW506_04935 [Thermoproteota archaeon]